MEPKLQPLLLNWLDEAPASHRPAPSDVRTLLKIVSQVNCAPLQLKNRFSVIPYSSSQKMQDKEWILPMK